MDPALTLLFGLSVVVVVIPMAVLPLAGRRALQVGDGRRVELLARRTRVACVASLLTAASGLGVVATYEEPGPAHEAVSFWSAYTDQAALQRIYMNQSINRINAPDLLSFGVDWVWASTALFAVALLVTLLVVVPALRRSGAELSGGRPEHAGAQYGRLATGSEAVVVLLGLAALLVLVES